MTRYKQSSTSKKKSISPLAETPFNVSEGVSAGGNEFLNAQRKPLITSWYCLKLKRDICVSPVALIEPRHGWICDCGSWTFGDDASHTPQGLQVFIHVSTKKRGVRK